LNSDVCKCDKRDSDCPGLNCQMNPVGNRFGIYDGRGWIIFARVFDFEKSYEAQTFIDFFLNYRCVYDNFGLFFQLNILVALSCDF